MLEIRGSAMTHFSGKVPVDLGVVVGWDEDGGSVARLESSGLTRTYLGLHLWQSTSQGMPYE